MKILTIKASVKLSKNYDSFGTEIKASITSDECSKEKSRELHALCRKLTVEQMKL